MSLESDWYDELADFLSSVHHLDKARVEEIVAEARAHCAATGERPHDTFGAAEDYAGQLVRGDEPDETRFRREAEGYASYGRRIGAQAFSWLGPALAGVGFVGWLLVGTWYPLTLASLFVFLGLTAGAIMLFVAKDLRLAGRPRRALKVTVVGWILLAAGSAAFLLPNIELFRVPLPGVLVAGIVLALVDVRVERGRHGADPAGPVEHPTREVWLDRLTELLVGRYRLSRAQAVELRDETASHLAESGADPQQEFGPVDVYAAELAERSGLQRRPNTRRRFNLVMIPFLALVFATTTGMVISENGWLDVRVGVLALITLFLVSSTIGNLLRAWRGRALRKTA